MAKIIATLTFLFSLHAAAVSFDTHEEACMAQTVEQVNDLAKAGVTIDLKETLQIYQTCVDENEGPSYQERCGDRPGGAYDRCTN